jgi:hypothetical protein
MERLDLHKSVPALALAIAQDINRKESFWIEPGLDPINPAIRLVGKPAYESLIRADTTGAFAYLALAQALRQPRIDCVTPDEETCKRDALTPLEFDLESYFQRSTAMLVLIPGKVLGRDRDLIAASYLAAGTGYVMGAYLGATESNAAWMPYGTRKTVHEAFPLDQDAENARLLRIVMHSCGRTFLEG